MTVLGPPLPGVLFVTSAYGPRHIDGAESFHDGIDLRAAIGTPLLAPADGIVEHTATDERCGKQLALRCGNGFRVVFCHLSIRNVAEGFAVVRGEVLGATGNSGQRASGQPVAPHLHMSVRQLGAGGSRGELVDPAPLLGLAGGSFLPVLLLAALAVGVS